MSAPAPSPAATAEPRRFTFDTVFDAGRVIAPARAKSSYSAPEAEALKAEAFAAGEASAVARAEAERTAATAKAQADIAAALGALKGLAHEHRVAASELALACGRAVAGAALDRFPEAAAQAALEALGREIEAQPRLLVHCAPEQADTLSRSLVEIAEAIGFAGAVAVRGEPAMTGAAFSFDWGDGRAAFDPAAASARVEAALEAALAAEGLHAEPPLPLERADP